MNLKNIFLLSLFALSAIGCVKHEVSKSEIKMPKRPKTESLLAKTSGYKCDLQVVNGESKEIFLESTKKDDSLTVSFHDFISSEKISILSMNFDDYTLMSLKLNSEGNEDKTVFTGSGRMTHNKHENLEIDGKILLISAQVTMDQDLNGTIERKMLISVESEIAPIWTEAEKIADISNCEKFDAILY